MKVWMWTAPDPLDVFIMLLFTDSEGNGYGINFNGAPANPRQVEVELNAIEVLCPPDWQRIA